MITKLSQIVEEAQKKGRKRLAVAYGQDSKKHGDLSFA